MSINLEPSNRRTLNLEEADLPQSFEDGPPEAALPGGHEPKVCHPIMDEDDAREDEYGRGYKDAARVGLEHIQAVLSSLHKFKGNGHFAVRCAMAAHGMWSLLSERDQVEIANHFGYTRANVNKLVMRIQERLELPPTLGQRSTEGCENMSERRKGQLATTKGTKGTKGRGTAESAESTKKGA